jgi:hypothetical protein
VSCCQKDLRRSIRHGKSSCIDAHIGEIHAVQLVTLGEEVIRPGDRPTVALSDARTVVRFAQGQLAHGDVCTGKALDVLLNLIRLLDSSSQDQALRARLLERGPQSAQIPRF